MKNASHRADDTRRGTDTVGSPIVDSSLPAFAIECFQRVQYGSKVATFKVVLPHIELDAEMFMPEGKAPFVSSGSVRSKYDGAYKRTARFSPEFGAALCAEALRLYVEAA
jgi:hypothetical protein